MKRQLEYINTFHNSDGTNDVAITRPLAIRSYHLYEHITFSSAQRLHNFANAVGAGQVPTWRIRLYRSGFLIYHVGPQPPSDALYACQQLTCFVDTRRSWQGGEEWWAGQAPALQEAYTTAQIAVRQGQGMTEAPDLLPTLQTIAGHAHRGAMANYLGAHTTCEQIAAETDDLLGALQRVMTYLSIHDPQYCECNADGLRARAAIAKASSEDMPG